MTYFINQTSPSVKVAPREFKIQDVTSANDVNGVLSLLNVGKYSEQPINHICQGFKVIKDDRGEPLTIVNNTYDLLQPTEAFAFLDCLKDELNFTYESAGFLNQGKQLFIQGSMGDFEVQTNKTKRVGDVLNKRIIARTSFDGSIATTIQVQLLRVWCSNGCASWQTDNHIAKVKHTSKQRDKMAYALSQVTGIRQVVQDLESDINLLSNVEVNQDQFNRINEIVFPSKKDSKRDKAKNIREAVASQFTNERLGAFGESAWDVFNAFTAYNTHDKTSRETRGKTSEENAFNSQSDALYVRKVRKAIQEVLSV